MIHGVVLHSEQDDQTQVLLSAYCDGSTAIQPPLQNQSSVVSRNLKRVWNSSLRLGVSVGACGERSMLISHLTCAGEFCHCAFMAHDFLFFNKNLEETLKSYLPRQMEEVRNSITFPALVIFVNKLELAAVTFLAEDDIRIEYLSRVPPYCIK